MLDERGVFKDIEKIRSFVSYEESLIVLRPGFSTDTIRERILHESLHACIEDSGLLDDLDQLAVEKIICALSPRLMSFVQSNSSIFEESYMRT
jgi:hypothetical protein